MTLIPRITPVKTGGQVDFSPISNAISENRLFGMKKQAMAQQQERHKQTMGMRQQEFDASQRDSSIKRAAGIAQMIAQDPNPQSATAKWQKFVGSNPQYGAAIQELGLDPLDYKAGAEALIAEARGFQDPHKQQMNALNMEHKRAQIANAKRGPAAPAEIREFQFAKQNGFDGNYMDWKNQGGSEDVRYGLTPVWGTNDQGETVLGVTGTDGSFKQVDTGSFDPTKGFQVVGGQAINKTNPNQRTDVTGAIASGETAKKIGADRGDKIAAFPKVQRSYESYKIKDQQVGKFIDRALSQANAGTTGFVGYASSYIKGSPAYDLTQTLNQVKSNLGFDKLQDMRDNSPTGGALGQVSNIELAMLQSVWGSVETAQSEDQLRWALNNLKEVKAQFKAQREKAYQEDLAKFGPEAMNGVSPQSSEETAQQDGDGWKTLPNGIRIREKR